MNLTGKIESYCRKNLGAFRRFVDDDSSALITNRLILTLLIIVFLASKIGNIDLLCSAGIEHCFSRSAVPYVFVPTLGILFYLVFESGKTNRPLSSRPSAAYLLLYLSVFGGYYLLLDPVSHPGFGPVAYFFQGFLLISGISLLPCYNYRSLAINTAMISGLALLGFSRYLLFSNPVLALATVLIESLLGAFIASLLLKNRWQSFYLKSLSQVIYDGVTSKNPIDVDGFLPDSMRYKEQKVYITIMFLDIVGYSLLNKRLDETSLKEMISDSYGNINKIASKHGGKIDKSLGDGLLLFFEDPDEAMNAAVQIQMTSLLRGIRNEKILPLRIGINTAEVLSADMGDKKRIDVTLMGEGVILAQRLESACNPYKIMVGEGTRQNLSDDWKEKDLGCECLIQIKHSPEPIRAWQYNPFDHDSELLRQADEIFWGSLGKEIKKGRFRLREDAGIVLRSDLGDFQLRDYSENGFGVTGDVLLGRGYSLDIAISGAGKVEQTLAEKLMHEISVSVVWSRRSDSGVLKMGLKIVGRNLEERKLISGLLSEYTEGKAA